MVDLICDLLINLLLNEVFGCFIDLVIHFFLDHGHNVVLDVITNFRFHHLSHLLKDLGVYESLNFIINSVLDLFLNKNLETFDQIGLNGRRNLDANEIIELTTHVNPDSVAIDLDNVGKLTLDANFVLFKLFSNFIISFVVDLNLHDVAHIIFQGLTSHIDGIFNLIIHILADLKLYLLLDHVLNGGWELVLEFTFEFGLKMGAYEFLDQGFNHGIVFWIDSNLDLVGKMLIYV